MAGVDLGEAPCAVPKCMHRSWGGDGTLYGVLEHREPL